MAHLDHIGLAVHNVEEVARLFHRLLGFEVYKTERVERQGVVAHFLSAGSAQLELLEALGPDSPVARYLKARGEGVHHLAFEVKDIHDHMQRMRDRGFTPLSEVPVPGADDKLIFFLHPKETHGILIEFCERVPASCERPASSLGLSDA